MSNKYPIGETGKKWCAVEKKRWLDIQQVKRSYPEEVVSKIKSLNSDFDIIQYGQLNYDFLYDLYAIKTRNWNNNNPTLLVTGGVHGYETSGVHGALSFLNNHAHNYEANFNIIVLPCISPWGYETINRWNPNAVDPNRSFIENSPSQEASLAMLFLEQYKDSILCHIDLHETTNTDNSEFRPALAARDGVENHNWNIPDGFYLVGHSQKPHPLFQKQIIEEVSKVTHIAKADENSKLIGVSIEQFGVINYDAAKLGLCMSVTSAPYVTTTEVYPDSNLTDPKNCIEGQVFAILGAIKYLNTLKDNK